MHESLFFIIDAYVPPMTEDTDDDSPKLVKSDSGNVYNYTFVQLAFIL